ncbi:MAG: DUF1062 domain-containing protein [Clostridiales bacterium]|nr:DUF1062 domain-containing protein [Clostridiales bacterium]
MRYCNTIKVYHRCGGCGRKRQFINTGRFRVNANGKNVDVWLIYQCIKCKHSWNLTIYERKQPSKIPADEYQKFLENDEVLAYRFGNDMAFLKRNKAEFE